MRNTITILGNPYDVIYQKGLTDVGDNTVHGVINFTDRKVLVNLDSPPFIQRETVLHEVIHGILHHSGLVEIIESETDEAIVRAITSGLSVLGLHNAITKGNDE